MFIDCCNHLSEVTEILTLSPLPPRVVPTMPIVHSTCVKDRKPAAADICTYFNTFPPVLCTSTPQAVTDIIVDKQNFFVCFTLKIFFYQLTIYFKHTVVLYAFLSLKDSSLFVFGEKVKICIWKNKSLTLFLKHMGEKKHGRLGTTFGWI